MNTRELCLWIAIVVNMVNVLVWMRAIHGWLSDLSEYSEALEKRVHLLEESQCRP